MAVFVVLASVLASYPASGSAAVRVIATGSNNPIFEGILHARQRDSYPTPSAIPASTAGFWTLGNSGLYKQHKRAAAGLQT